MSKFQFLEIYEQETETRTKLFLAYLELAEIFESLTGLSAPRDHIKLVKRLVEATGARRKEPDWTWLIAKVKAVLKLLRNAEPSLKRLSEIDKLEQPKTEIRQDGSFPTYTVRTIISGKTYQDLQRILRRGRPGADPRLIELVCQWEPELTAVQIYRKYSRQLKKEIFPKHSDPTSIRRAIQHVIERYRH